MHTETARPEAVGSPSWALQRTRIPYFARGASSLPLDLASWPPYASLPLTYHPVPDIA